MEQRSHRPAPTDFRPRYRTLPHPPCLFLFIGSISPSSEIQAGPMLVINMTRITAFTTMAFAAAACGTLDLAAYQANRSEQGNELDQTMKFRREPPQKWLVDKSHQNDVHQLFPT